MFSIELQPWFSRGLGSLATEATDGGARSVRSIGPTYYHPHAVGRYAPAIMRLQRTAVHASGLARPIAADQRGRLDRGISQTLKRRP